MKTCVSGGAKGSDLAWGTYAEPAGYRIIHASFSGHQTNARPDQLKIYLQPELDLALPALLLANKALKRQRPDTESHRGRLLARNFYQVQEPVEAVYAITTQVYEDGTVAGGTGWAVQMFIDRCDQRLCVPYPTYVFEQTRRSWFQRARQGWTKIDQPPPPPSHFAGIGTRKLNRDGERAIKELLHPTEQVLLERRAR